MKILNVLSSNKYSGAENVVCQIADLFADENKTYYCSPKGPIEQSLADKKVTYIGIDKMKVSLLKKVIKQVKPNIVHAHDVKACFYSSLACNKTPLICHLHCNEKSTQKISIKSILFDYACRKAKQIFFVSNSSYNDYIFKNRVKDKSLVLENVISIANLEDKIKQDNNSYAYDVIFLGRLAEPKNPLRLMEILHLLVQEDKTLRCAIVGDGEYRQKCEEFIKENGLADNIKMMGFVSNPYKILNSSKVMLMSSLSEGMPMCALESIALGVPIVSTATGGLVDLINNGKVGFLYETNEEAVKYIKDIIKDFAKYRDICLSYSQKVNDLKSYKNSIDLAYKNAIK